MTKTEFLENTATWGDLIDFCDAHGCEICDDIYDEGRRDEAVCEDVCDCINNGEYNWWEIGELLRDIPVHDGEYYRKLYDFRWEAVDGDDALFGEYLVSVCSWADAVGDIWEDEDDEEWAGDYDEEDEKDEESEADEAPEDEDFSVGDLIGMCGAVYATINEDRMQSIHELDRAFDELIADIPNVIE